MNCVICRHGDTAPSFVTVTLTRGASTVVFKDVPAEVCENCGEYYLSETVAAQLYARAEQAVAAHTEIEVIRYAA